MIEIASSREAGLAMTKLYIRELVYICGLVLSYE